ncbi:MAG: UDP-N-acetylmuramate dehydrogenase [Nitrospirota bacterium]
MKSEKLKDIFSGDLFKGETRFMEPMMNHTSLRIGGPADVFVIPRDFPSLKNILVILRRRGIPFLPLGGGTNVLVRDGGIEGVVISLKSFRKIEILSEDKVDVKVYVEAGTPIQRLVNFSREKGYSGIEGLAGIPGFVGGAICGNAGAFGYEMKDVLISVSIMDAEGRIERLRAKDIDFGYRKSSISSTELLLSAEIILEKDKEEYVSARIEDFLKRKWESQPISEPSAGCVFKNPHGLSAGRLIDEAGCKGMGIGDVEVSSIHANFFINKGRARASDFIRLMEEVAQRVKKRFGVLLEPEIRIVGRNEV